ncbi:oxalate decarboxylase like protein [Zymoseptoria brevis]|uniref:Oxalate decarboxylase like protein n=1 Tax=Zymoseptoria brevis TaxID=1047168 RepID=A0A0F4GA31_9PEZI|nr:oxalate decarboxylase like protein [Zymoseptoria brevis]
MKFSLLLAGAFAFTANGSPFPVPTRDKQDSALVKKAFNFQRGLPSTIKSKHLRPHLERRSGEYQETPIGSSHAPDVTVPGYASGELAKGEPNNDDTKKGATLLGGTNSIIDVQNPSNLGQESTDTGVVPNLKWRFSDSKTALFNGGWAREQVITDLPASVDISSAQQHLKKGAYRELHWHRVSEWAFVYAGRVAISAVNEFGQNQYEILEVGDIWFFPKGVAHGVQGLDDENEFLLAFDDGDFDATGVTFNVDDWITHTPKHILAKNFGVDVSVFQNTPKTNPKILQGIAPPDSTKADHPFGDLTKTKLTYVIRSKDVPPTIVPGGGGSIQTFDSRNFPIATTIASSVVRIKPGGLRELHWHPNADEWIFFAQGQARATVFLGGSASRTFDFTAGDTAVFPSNSGHYVENTSPTEELIWIELYKAERVADISLTQWLALTPKEVVAQALNVSTEIVETLKKEKQVIIA